MTKKLFITVLAFLALSSGFLYHSAYWFWGENFLSFFVGLAQSPLQVGAFTPCSRFVAKKITNQVKKAPDTGHLRVLEVGAGSGIFTQKLEKILGRRSSPYTLDVVEIEKKYCSLLHKRFDKNNNISIYCTDILNWKPPYKYDYIVSALPFALLPFDFIKSVFSLYKNLLKPSGVLSYYEHMWLPRLKQHFLKASEKENYKTKRSYLKNFRRKFVFQEEDIWANITPVRVYHGQFKKTTYFLTNKRDS